jgi:hypothetical protein
MALTNLVSSAFQFLTSLTSGLHGNDFCSITWRVISSWDDSTYSKPLFYAVIHTRNGKNTLFISIFPRFLLRSKDSLAIVPNGPDFFPSLFRTKGSQPAPGQLGKKQKKERKNQEDKQTRWQPSL